MTGKPIDGAVRDARQIIDEFIQCAEAGRPHGKLIAQARDWLALTAAQQQACECRNCEVCDGREAIAAQQQGQAVACVCCEDKPAPGNNPCACCGRTAPPSAPDVAMEAWHSAVDNAAELRANAPDERYAKRAASVESWIKANRPAPPSVPVGVEGLVQRLAGALAMYDQNRTTMQSLAGSVGDFLHCYHSLSQQPAASDSWRDAFVAERARRYRDGGMKIEQARIQAESDADLAIAIAAQQPAAVDGAMVDRFIRKYQELEPGDDVPAVDDPETRRFAETLLTAALAAQPGGSDNDR